ncbi:MAG: putative toxin-antitoxin system toxin component, PIN family [Burkholderiales bacterium]|nr:putative toxin-antitoxin system toxin component, PIN family [Burkholderiales bacterium]
MPMRLVVLDTNVWLDLLVFQDATAAPLGAALADGRLGATMDDQARDELERVLAYPLGRFSLDAAGRRRALARAGELSRRFERDAGAAAPADLPACRDRDDQPFLELARDAGAAWLVSKDRDLLMLARRARLPFAILAPRAACALLAAP